MLTLQFNSNGNQVLAGTVSLTDRVQRIRIQAGREMRLVRRLTSKTFQGDATHYKHYHLSTHPEVLGYAIVTKRRRVPLDHITWDEVAKAGFPGHAPSEYVEWMIRLFGCGPSEIVTRIEFDMVAIGEVDDIRDVLAMRRKRERVAVGAGATATVAG